MNSVCHRSVVTASHAGRSAARRPSTHNPASAARGNQRTGSCPVQLGMAVGKKPGDRRHHEAEQYFMDVPGDRIEVLG